MSPEERQEFEELLKDDESFRNKFEEHKSVFNAFKINEAKKIKAKLKAHETQESTKKRFISKPVIYSIAATFIVLIGMSVYFNFFQQDLYKQYFEPYPNVYQPVVRGDAEESTKAFMYYENKKYTEAQNSFKSLLEKEDNPNVRFYYALSFLNQNQPKQAIDELKKLKNIKFEFQAEVYWYLALSEIKLEKFDSAKSNLRDLTSKHPKFKKDKVESLLDNL
jgi:tetratricopeptide (TPR) repeat protein